MVSGHLQQKKGNWYIVLNLHDETGKRAPKWIATHLTVQGNKRRAEEMLLQARQQYTDIYGKPGPSGPLFADYMLQWLARMKGKVLYQMTYNSSYYGFTVQTSITAMYMTFGAIVAAVNAKHEEKKSKKIIDVVFALVFVTGILFVTRRGSFLAILLILAYIYFDTSKSKASRVLLLIVGALFLLHFGIDKIPGMQGMLDKFSRLSGNMMNGRQNIWEIALNNLWRHPLFGYGVGRANVTGGGASVDNAYIAVLVERGIIGMIVFFIPYIHTLVQTYSRRKKCGAASKSLETSFYFQLLFIIMSVMENYYGQALTMFVYFLMVFSAQFDDQREKK